MLIDWFTVGSQALNFIILVWLMKRYLYKPILNTIAEREKIIAEKVANSVTLKTQAEGMKDEYKRKNDDFDQQRENLLNKAQQEVKNERKKQMDEVRTEANQLRTKWQASLLAEQKEISYTIQQQARDEVFSISRRTLKDLAGANLEQQITEVLIIRLRLLDKKDKADFKVALLQNHQTVTIRCTFDLPAPQRDALKIAIKETFDVDCTITFETTPTLISGIELTTNGQKIAWNIADYLESLKTNVGDILKIPSKPEA